MGNHASEPRGPDLAAGVPADSVHEGVPLLGFVEGEPVILVRRGADIFAIGATCTHYGGPLAEGLVDDGHSVEHVATGAEAVAALDEHEMVLLDLGLPDVDGREVCRAIRQRSKVPIIMITARGDEFDRVLGLELGADDYITKPFSMREVLARLRAVARRTSPTSLDATPHASATARHFATSTSSAPSTTVSVTRGTCAFAARAKSRMPSKAFAPNVEGQCFP